MKRRKLPSFGAGIEKLSFLINSEVSFREQSAVVRMPPLEIDVDATTTGPKVTTLELFRRADSRSSEVLRVPMK